MAKKNGITISDALIPKDDYPYDVPNNWCWVKLGAISSIISKGTTPKGGKSAYVDEGIDFLRVENINDDGTICHDNMMHVTEETHTGFLKRSMLEENDVLVSIAGTLGKTAIVKKDDLPLNTNQAVAFVRLADNGEISRDFIRYAIDTPVIQNMLLAKTKVTAIPNLTLEIISDCLIPLPPLAEQKRIVEQIENLFSKLDEAKEKVQGVVEQFELHKESILHQAFSGYLSEKWRIENGLSADSWVQTSLGTYLNPMKTRKPEGETFRYIDIDAIDNKKQVIREAKETPVSEAPSRASRAVNSGDVLFSMVRPYLKNIAYVTEDMSDCIASTGFYVCSCKDGLYSKYLYELLRSKDAIDYLMQFMKGDNSPSIRKDDLLDMPLKLPCIDEQKEICQIVSSLLQKEEEAKEAAVKVIDQIDLMKKSILAKAFRGELGTNIADEESSIELLKSIIEA